MILLVWDGLPSVNIVIGAEVFLCVLKSVLGGRSISRRVECGQTVKREAVSAK